MNCMSTSVVPVPLHSGQRPLSTLKEKWPAVIPRALADGRGGEEPADLVVGLDVGDRVRARRAADRPLVDQGDVGELVEAGELVALAGLDVDDAARALVGAEEHVLDQGRLARARDAGHRHHQAEREVDVEPLQVVGAGAADAHPGRARARRRGCRGPARGGSAPGARAPAVGGRSRR
jgi:hypothetical protein